MTTLDTRTAAFVDDRDKPTSPPPPPPDPTNVQASALVLLGTLIAAGIGVHRQPDGVEIAASAVFAAILLFLGCVARYDLGRQS